MASPPGARGSYREESDSKRGFRGGGASRVGLRGWEGQCKRDVSARARVVL